MSLSDEEKREATTYLIQKAFGKSDIKGVYRIGKMVMGVEVDNYHVTIKETTGGLSNLWCDCPGFRNQQFPKIEHKHVKIALAYREQGEPEQAVYTINGTGKTAKIRFLRSSENG